MLIVTSAVLYDDGEKGISRKCELDIPLALADERLEAISPSSGDGLSTQGNCECRENGALAT